MNRQTLALRETVLGLEHPDTLTSIYHLAHLLAQSRWYPESLASTKERARGITLSLETITQPLVPVANIMLRLEWMLHKTSVHPHSLQQHQVAMQLHIHGRCQSSQVG